ncbi:type II CRISPR RNA-guided endonuclease Cas9 [Bacteroides heparinolyticus]|uniref:type II CRISPR RNA-guided endonuclease Cas9 n=1 Tax=Prevotella heparinolytica TaxID=28113 RepID=UPI003AF0AA0C
MKRILGLDLGTNSIGWAVLNSETVEQTEKMWIEMAGSRIIPMDAATLGDFDKGNSTSQTAERTRLRAARHLIERCLLRRERLHKVLHILDFLPEHYSKQLNWDEHAGQFCKQSEPKLAWEKKENGQFDFIFQTAFNEMLADFAQYQPALVENNKKVPYDWTIYYLRKKALTQKISKQELAWIILNFNQKRGYYQLRGEEEEEVKNKLVEYHALKVTRVEATDEKKGKDIWYNVYLDNGWIYRRASNVPLDWEGKIKEFIVTTDLNEDGTIKIDKRGEIKRSFRAPNEDDWTLIKKKTEADISDSHKTIGWYIYDTLLQKPQQKIRGKLVRTVERKYYKEELKQILERQSTFHAELQDRELYKQCLDCLYPQNEAHKQNIANRDFCYLFIEDIIFYQRPLKSKKSLISNCPYEKNKYVDKETGEIKQVALKCIAKSHPLFQEFRLWQFISNLRIYQKEKTIEGKLHTDVDITKEILQNEEDYTSLYEWLNERKEIDQKSFLKCPLLGLKNEVANYRWNYVEDRVYPCNETRYLIKSRIEKAKASLDNVLSTENETALWHILYSVSDKQELEKALSTFALKHHLNKETFVEVFKKAPPFEKEYGSYSAKAIKKLLPLIRMGKYWSEDCIDEVTKERIKKTIIGECEEAVNRLIRDKAIQLQKVDNFRGLPLWLACYIVYGRHSEAKDITKWEEPADIDAYLASFKQHSLRNPIVEQIIVETLRVVRDIWKRSGSIDEIHIELGREMKAPAKQREKMSMQILENENANLRIKMLLQEFINPEYEIENVRPYSPSQQELLRIYEDGIFNQVTSVPEDIEDLLKKLKDRKAPSKSEFMRYKLWLEQKYRSPYTGEVIPLAKLFTPAYEIEHIIPQSRFFDDSFSNKVICESEVNKLKDRSLAYEFIKEHPGEKVELSFGKPVRIFTVEEYELFVKEHYSKSRTKMKKLLMDDIPDTFVERQLNDSRYISKVVKTLLSNIVRKKDANGEYEQEAISKNVIVCTGSITDRLKKDWGINDVWNNIISFRFERLNQLKQTQCFGHWENKDGKRFFQTDLPLEYQKGFSKKRIDHRHHAMDAIVIACASRNHINYLNNESARKNSPISRYDLQRLLCDKHKTDESGNYKWVIKKPWNTFTQDVQVVLNETIVSFKQNLRIINKNTNYYWSYNSNGKKVLSSQTKGDNWAVRKSLHKDTVFGRVNLRMTKEVRLSIALDTPEMIVDKQLKRKIKQLIDYKYDKKRIEKYFKENAVLWKNVNLAKVAIYYFTDTTSEPMVATRKPLDTSFTYKKILSSVTDTGIQKILLAHLKNKEENSELAFSPDGIDEMNQNLKELNGGKLHQPIYKVRVYEPLGYKFNVGETGNKTQKFVEADKGTNLFFAVYANEDGKRAYETIPLNVVIERKKQGATPVPDRNEAGNKLLFWLSPNDLVYVPTEDEIERGKIEEPIDRRRIYKMVSSTSYQCFFIPYYIANPIIDTIELGSNNKAEKAWSGEMIKSICIPISVDRLGNIVKKGYLM